MKSLVLVLLITACSHSTTSVDSRTFPGAAPVRSIMVFTNMPDAPFAGSMNMGFESRFRAGLSECGANPEFRAVVEDGGDFIARSEASMQAMGTNAALFVKEAGGRTTAYHDGTQGPVNARSFDVWVKLQLFDRRAHKVTWEALVHYDGFKNGEVTYQDGEAFAAAVGAKLRSDGMLVGCT